MAVANAGVLQYQYQYQPAALTSTQDNILRSPGNLAQISTQSKTIQTPYSSSSKSDIRVTNPAVVAHTAPVYGAYAAAPVSYGYAAAPVAHAAPLSYAAPVAHAAPLSYAAPVAHAAAPAGSLLGVAYSPAVAVSHMTYNSPFGVYSW